MVIHVQCIGRNSGAASLNHKKKPPNNLKWVDIDSIQYNPRILPYAWFWTWWRYLWLYYYLLLQILYSMVLLQYEFYFRSGTGGNASVSSVLLSSEELERYFPDKRLKIWVGCWNMGELKVRFWYMIIITCTV